MVRGAVRLKRDSERDRMRDDLRRFKVSRVSIVGCCIGTIDGGREV